MKRILALLICVLLAGSTIAFPAAAETSDAYGDQIIISRKVEDLGNGCFYVETISVPSIQPYSNTKRGTKTAVYTAAGTSIYAVSVTGDFTYDGTTSKATSADSSVATYVDGVSITSRDAYTFGASAVASATVSYKGETLSKTVRLTCDRNGNLS